MQSGPRLLFPHAGLISLISTGLHIRFVIACCVRNGVGRVGKFSHMHSVWCNDGRRTRSGAWQRILRSFLYHLVQERCLVYSRLIIAKLVCCNDQALSHRLSILCLPEITHMTEFFQAFRSPPFFNWSKTGGWNGLGTRLGLHHLHALLTFSNIRILSTHFPSAYPADGTWSVWPGSQVWPKQTSHRTGECIVL